MLSEQNNTFHIFNAISYHLKTSSQYCLYVDHVQTSTFPGITSSGGNNMQNHACLFVESGSAICTFFLTSTCSKGSLCPFRHIKGERAVVCKHWLRGLCKKGDDCEFLHEFDMTKMPECYFFSRFGKLQLC